MKQGVKQTVYRELNTPLQQITRLLNVRDKLKLHFLSPFLSAVGRFCQIFDMTQRD